MSKPEKEKLERENWEAAWLEMEFVPVKGTEVRFCVWKTRVQDYMAFTTATNRTWYKPGFQQGPTHPAVYVSWEDAKAFCQWRTKKDRKAGRLSEDQEYRLPTDAEWSVAVGLPLEAGNTPQEKDGKIKDVYPWGRQWPPPKGAGNYGQSLNVDTYENTSPVGSFKANEFGLYDLGGNAWEWCEDRYNPSQDWRVLRGGSWRDDGPAFLLSSRRYGGTPAGRNGDDGFRCVVAVGSSAR